MTMAGLPSLSIFQVVMISSTVCLAAPVSPSLWSGRACGRVPADGQVAHVLVLPAAWPRLEP